VLEARTPLDRRLDDSIMESDARHLYLHVDVFSIFDRRQRFFGHGKHQHGVTRSRSIVSMGIASILIHEVVEIILPFNIQYIITLFSLLLTQCDAIDVLS
jgi:hypothetical protein